MALINQNLQNYTAQDFTPIPPAEYDFEINDSDVVDTKTGKRMIKVSCRVLGPTHVGRVVFENFVMGNDVAMIRLKTLATMAGHPRPDYIQDTQELHGLRFRANVGVKENPGFSPQNYIKSFKKIDVPGNPVAPTQAAPQHQAPGFRPPAPPPPPPAAPPRTLFPPPPPPMQPPLAAPQPAQAAKPPAPWVK